MIVALSRADRELVPSRPGDARERERQRAARLREAGERADRDGQRRDRIDQHTYLVFPDRAAADEVMQEIGATPILADGLAWPVLIWDEDARVAIGTQEATDERVAVGHRWSEKERAWLGDYLAGWRTVAIIDALPADWVPKDNDEPIRDEEPGRR